ncbi:MAG TPA: DUF4446 family protein [Candidatus Portnoybacteria bacterium]|jgi:hypothetical protein|nr:DUF4446 family protein [Candidatus Portnoybacteria bacterium]MDD5752408.1 DUF4446 family protein [Candidatus Portnoybacteria bacterium]HNU96740.1 DUF4446 family protein [Candidatus Portnoybacteria bacterium]HOZ16522.1 DUF4446 family protein [Candidatus Portnoybacteria bacterium]HPH52281.1 DUF4446 family protein [Candidatus Portnoybacteria bacterium]
MNILTNNIILIILIILIIADIILIFLWLKTRKKIKIFMKGSKIVDVEEVITGQIKLIKEIKNDIKKLSNWNEKLQQISNIAITKVGVVRFNPFKDTGGDQSFAIALLDSNDNGLVISSLYSREGTRIYTKPIEAGKSINYNLSDEEQEAISKAIK